MAEGGLTWLAAADAASRTAAERVRALERVGSRYTAARARVLYPFSA